MASAVLNQVKSFSNHPPPMNQPLPPYAHHASSQPTTYNSLSGLISPPVSHGPESRRQSDDPEKLPPHRQSLPSIQEALYARPPAPPVHPLSIAPNFPNPFATTQAPPTPTSRSYADNTPPYTAQGAHHPRQSPPPPAHPSNSAYMGNGHMNGPVSDGQRHQSLPSLRTALPSQTSPYGPHHTEPSRYETEQRLLDRNNTEPLPPQRQQNDPYYGYPAQTANGYASGYPPRSPVYFAPRVYGRDDLGGGEKLDLKNGEPETRPVFQKTLKHNLGNHDFEMALGELQQCGSEITKISEEILDTVRRYQHTDPDRQGVPVMRYHDAVLGVQRKVEDAFQNVKYFMAQQQHVIEDQRMRSQSGKGTDYGDDDQWGSEKDTGFHGGHPDKKRRGRAAPPGRCHSCNRAETPEWRRGPDGARTLCNACGLHYAKLTRRMGSKHAQGASSLRPKSMDETSPV